MTRSLQLPRTSRPGCRARPAGQVQSKCVSVCLRGSRFCVGGIRLLHLGMGPGPPPVAASLRPSGTDRSGRDTHHDLPRLRTVLNSFHPSTAAGPSDRRAYRLSSIDILRGLVIALMALDHVRDFVMTAAAQDPTADPATGPLLFATRWITHFCAPTFVFLAGTSAGLMAARKTPAELATFLLTRGLWLIALEVFVVSTAWTFAPTGVAGFGGRTYVALQVIWAIGASMVLLAAAQFLGRRACLAIGAAILLGHNLLDRKSVV